jgi:hypothetical protein
VLSRSTQVPAVVAGFDDVAVVGEAVEQRRDDLSVGEDVRPYGEGEVGRGDYGCALVEPADQMEQQLAAGLREWQAAGCVDPAGCCLLFSGCGRMVRRTPAGHEPQYDQGGSQ